MTTQRRKRVAKELVLLTHEEREQNSCNFMISYSINETGKLEIVDVIKWAIACLIIGIIPESKILWRSFNLEKHSATNFLSQEVQRSWQLYFQKS